MDSIKLHLAVVLVRAIYAGLQIMTKAAFDGGMSTSVFVFYRQLLATIFLTPIAVFVGRKNAPPLSFKICFKIFMLAFLGMTSTPDLHTFALSYTTPTLASATINSIPVITFILAAILGMETLKLRKLSGIVMVTGLALCSAGVLIIAMYIGPSINSPNHHLLIGHGSSHAVQSYSGSSKKLWAIGTSIMTMSNLTWSLWLVLQGPVLKEYPSKLLFTALQSVFSTVQTLLVALAMERDFSRWRLASEMSLISIVYCGIIVTGVAFYLQSWCVEKRGPVFLAMSTPLTLVFTIACSSFMLGESINLGSGIGGVLMVGGLYSVLWGQNKEQNENTIPVIEEKKMHLDKNEMVTEQRDTDANMCP